MSVLQTFPISLGILIHLKGVLTKPESPKSASPFLPPPHPCEPQNCAEWMARTAAGPSPDH